MRTAAPDREAAGKRFENSRLGLDVEEVVAGEFGLVGDEGKARFRLGAHQPTAGPGDQQVNVPTADRARRASQDALPTFL